jgi:1,4-alpha-glucan branching enzyme
MTTTTKRKRVKFEVLAEPKSKVFLAGSFNNWNGKVKELKDNDGSGCYSSTLLLEFGEYEYKFVIDGKWQIDAENPNFNQNEMGTLNSVVKVAAASKK